MTCIYYIDYKEQPNDYCGNRLLNRLFFRFKVIGIDSDKKVIYINKKYINKKVYKKLRRYIENHNFPQLSKNVLLAKDIQLNCSRELLYVVQEKKIMKAVINQLLKYIEKIVEADFRNESVSVLLCKDNNENIVTDIAEIFKGVNVVTTKLGNIRRMEKKIQKNSDIILSITNNRRKALKRAKIIINLDFNNNILNEFTINRNSIIVNFNQSKLELKNSFHGTIINMAEIDFVNKYKDHIDESHYNVIDLYESFLHNFNYKEAKEVAENDKCIIKNLVGNRGKISVEELKNNFTNSTIKLDKLEKKD